MMRGSLLSFPTAETVQCSACGNKSARVHWETESFPYGVGENQVTLTARVPVVSCEECGIEITDDAAEEIRHAAICRHLGRLSPAEVRAIRDQYQLTQDEWAKQTKLGVASVKRWEAGNLIQNDAMDRYLRLLAIPSNLARVSEVNEMSVHDRQFVFQTTLPPVVLELACAFKLRKAS